VTANRAMWGAPKTHGESLKLGIDVAQSTVSIYMVPRRDRPLRPLCGADHRLLASIRISCSKPRTAALVVVRGDPQSDGRVVGTPNHRSVSLGQRTEEGWWTGT
jgi:hypothetical protein